MKTTLFDLIWKLKRALEKEGHAEINLQKFTEDGEYRRSILLKADSSQFQFSAGIKAIYPDLLKDEALDLTKEIDLQQAEADNYPDYHEAKNATAASVETVAAEKPASGMGKPVVIALLLLLLGGFGYLFTALQGSVNESPVTEVAVQPQSQPSPQPVPPLTSQSTSTVAPVVSNVAVSVPAGTPAVAAISEVAQPQQIETLFRLHGSNTIGETLAPELLKAFLKAEGSEDAKLMATDVAVENELLFSLPGSEQSSRIEIHAHGSSTGFKGLDQGVADLAMASRRIKDKEVEKLQSRFGNLRSRGTEHIIGMDGLAVIVNPENPLNDLSTAQLAALFSGQVKNWSAFGGGDMPVRIYARDANSGTWDSFKSMVLKKHGVELSSDAARIESSIELSDQVSKERGAIGFIGLPYILRAKALAISDEEKAQPIYPTSFTISTEDYPLVRRLYMYEPASVDTASVLHRFVSFALSEAGQDVVKKAGFISQNISQNRPALSADLPPTYRRLTQNAERLSLNFRFNSSTTILDNKAQRDLDRVVRFFEDNPAQNVILIGFSDSIGEPEANQRLSLLRAQAVEQALFARGINVKQVQGMGEAVPIASNLTRAGRQRNRRVEIWVRSDIGLAQLQ